MLEIPVLFSLTQKVVLPQSKLLKEVSVGGPAGLQCRWSWGLVGESELKVMESSQLAKCL